MANIKTTAKQWGMAREYYEAGLSLSAIVDKTGISKTQLSKISNREGWAKGTEKEQLVADAVRVGMAKGILTEQALTVHNELVNQRVKRQEWLNVQAFRNVKQAMEAPCEGQIDYQRRAGTIQTTQEIAFGKTPDTAIQINNNPVIPSKPKDLGKLTEKELDLYITLQSKVEDDQPG